jgi:hypothetical protein
MVVLDNFKCVLITVQFSVAISSRVNLLRGERIAPDHQFTDFFMKNSAGRQLLAKKSALA